MPLGYGAPAPPRIVVHDADPNTGSGSRIAGAMVGGQAPQASWMQMDSRL